MVFDFIMWREDKFLCVCRDGSCWVFSFSLRVGAASMKTDG